MIIQDFSIDEYNWKVKVFYDIEDWAIPMIVDEVKLLGPYEEDIEDIYESLAKRTPNTGYIYSNIIDGKSVIIIEKTTSAAEFQDTFDHEKGHLAMHISIAKKIDPFSEEFQYLNGTIGHEMFKVAKRFLCDHCRSKE